MADTTIVYNDNLLMSYFEKRALATLHDKVWFYQVAEKHPLPKGSGQSMTFNGWQTLAAASVTLGETTANTAVTLSSRKISATIASYGRSIRFSDTLELTSILPVEPGALRELEHSAALSVDNALQLAVFKNVLAQVGQNASVKTGILSSLMSARASSMCANTGTTSNSRQFGFPFVYGTSCVRLSAVNAEAPSMSARLGPIAVRKAVARLKKLNAEPMSDGYFVGIAHPNAIATMLGNPDYKAWVQGYASGAQETMYKHEVSKCHQVRFIESTNCPRYAVTAHSVNLTPIFGRGALGVTELDGGVKMLLKRPGPQSTDNPYDLYSTLSYKVRIAGAALNPSAGVILATHEKI